MGLLLLGAAAQKWVPMPRWSRVLGHHAAVPDAWLGQEVVRLPAIAASPVERQVAVAVKSGVQRLPFEPTCLAQATAGQIMLRVRHSAGVVVIGLRPNPDGQDGRWDAHAWLLGRAGALTGGAAARGFTAATVFQVPQAPDGGTGSAARRLIKGGQQPHISRSRCCCSSDTSTSGRNGSALAASSRSSPW